MIKYWKQWRAWTEQRMKDYENQLIGEAISIIQDGDYSPRFRAELVIALVRAESKKPW